MIRVCCDVREYPDDAKEYRTLFVRNHWNHQDRVVLCLGENKELVVLASDLRAAIDNCTNVARF